jgi:hypothetical protein
VYGVVEVHRAVRFGQPQLDALPPERVQHGAKLVSVERSLVLSDDDGIERTVWLLRGCHQLGRGGPFPPGQPT